jgi:hypothetical protein
MIRKYVESSRISSGKRPESFYPKTKFFGLRVDGTNKQVALNTGQPYAVFALPH